MVLRWVWDETSAAIFFLWVGNVGQDEEDFVLHPDKQKAIPNRVRLKQESRWARKERRTEAGKRGRETSSIKDTKPSHQRIRLFRYKPCCSSSCSTPGKDSLRRTERGILPGTCRDRTSQHCIQTACHIPHRNRLAYSPSRTSNPRPTTKPMLSTKPFASTQT